ncbi:hypothetical protein DRJ25_00235 [Candidatus Woesearchaeota archaeon]|nr:MAG: hypothetical protein DRJ25_00235 [Candidatus Woesearchaeota archaeon]
MAKNMPEKKFRAGAVSATVWKNIQEKDGTEFEFFSVALERGYKDKTGQWKSTASLRVMDLPKAALVLQEAYRYIVLNDQSNEALAV